MIVITGAAGFIGSNIFEGLNNIGISSQVILFDNIYKKR